MATFKIGKVVMKSLFKKPATLMYPVIPREWAERTRGHIDIDEKSCILCGICGKKCPTSAITVDKAARTWTIERMQCIQCGCCVEVCPKKCLDMAPDYTEPGTEKVVDIFEVPQPVKKTDAGGAAAPAGGELECTIDDCIYCGICAKNCPVTALEVDRKEKVWKVDKDACVACGVCVEKCPKKCLEIK